MRASILCLAFSLSVLPAIADEEPPAVGADYQETVDEAWAEAAGLENPANTCAAVKGRVKGLITRGDSREAVLEQAGAALEACDFQIPMRYFGAFLDAVEQEDKTCMDLMRAMATQLTALTLDVGLREEDTDPKKRIKEALRERVETTCPEIAPMVLR